MSMHSGGWNINPVVNKNFPEMTKEHYKIFSDAFEGFDGAGYQPLVHIGQQVVAGMNHSYLALQKIILPGDHKNALVKVELYVPLEGHPVIISIVAI